MALSTLDEESARIESEVKKILPNTLYLTFNAPEVDDYHRALFITADSPLPTTAGTLFHACYEAGKWALETNLVSNCSNSKSLVLMWNVGSVNGTVARVEEVLEQVPFENDPTASDRERKGNPNLGGYSCVLWTEDALKALCKEGVIAASEDEIEHIMIHSRELAGPKDARLMVGKDFGGLRVVNDHKLKEMRPSH